MDNEMEIDKAFDKMDSLGDDEFYAQIAKLQDSEMPVGPAKKIMAGCYDCNAELTEGNFYIHKIEYNGDIYIRFKCPNGHIGESITNYYGDFDNPL